MADQVDISDKGGTMRLGLYPCKLDETSKSYGVYNKDLIYERHRHRWEFNNKFRTELTNAGLKIVGTSPDDRLVEMIEVPDHPWFVGCQFHPELKSRPTNAHPLFRGLVKAALDNKK
jgi:CTP synthase